MILPTFETEVVISGLREHIGGLEFEIEENTKAMAIANDKVIAIEKERNHRRRPTLEKWRRAVLYCFDNDQVLHRKIIRVKEAIALLEGMTAPKLPEAEQEKDPYHEQRKFEHGDSSKHPSAETPAGHAGTTSATPSTEGAGHGN